MLTLLIGASLSQFQDNFLRLGPGQCFIVSPCPGSADYAFYEHFALQALNLKTGTNCQLLAPKVLRNTLSQFLGVADFDGDGAIEIVGESTSVSYINHTTIRNPVDIHVWRFKNGEFKEVYMTNNSQPHWAIGSFILRTGHQTPPIMVTNELHEIAGGKVDIYLHLYRWDGKRISELANSRTLVHGLYHQGFCVADLDGDGTDEIITKSSLGGDHITVLQWDGKALLKRWESPRMEDITFGRTADYNRDNREETALLNDVSMNPNASHIALLRTQGKDIVGWESMTYYQPPLNQPSVDQLSDRFMVTGKPKIDGGIMQYSLCLDGKPLMYLLPTNSAPNVIFNGLEIKKHIINAVKHKVTMDQVIKDGRAIKIEGKESDMYIIKAGEEVVLQLSEEDAKAYRMPLVTLATIWLDTITKAISTLEKPNR